MSRYVVVRFPIAQAAAAANACDLIRDSHEAGNENREAAIYKRACETIQAAIRGKR